MPGLGLAQASIIADLLGLAESNAYAGSEEFSTCAAVRENLGGAGYNGSMLPLQTRFAAAQPPAAGRRRSSSYSGKPWAKSPRDQTPARPARPDVGPPPHFE